MEASRAATGMLDVLATRDVLFMILSDLPSTNMVSCGRTTERKHFSGRLSWFHFVHMQTCHFDLTQKLNVREKKSEQKNRLNKIVNIATKLINLKQNSLNDLYQQAISKKSRSIINDPSHPLHSCYEIMPSGKRYRTPAFKRQLYNKSFIPSAVRFLNSQKIL